MTVAKKRIIRMVADEEVTIVALLDQRAALEGTTRSALIRRAVRLMLSSLSDIPISGNISNQRG